MAAYLLLIATLLSSSLPGEENDYFLPLRREEERDARYIITTLAEKSMIGLLWSERSLREAGKRIDHIHPLKFLLFVFTDGATKNAVKKIDSYPWKRFANDLAESLDAAAKKGLIREEHMNDFAARTGLSKRFIKKTDWQNIINALRNR